MSLLKALKLPTMPTLPGGPVDPSNRPTAPQTTPRTGPAPMPETPSPAPRNKRPISEAVDAMLAQQVSAADREMNAALAAANNVGNPLNQRTQGQPDSPARKYWQAGMTRYWQPGSSARQQALALSGAARILKAREAAALLAKARVVFQKGLGLIG